MIVLDTNVVSEPLKAVCDDAVVTWLDRQESQTLFLTAVNAAELLAGVERMPTGQRRANLEIRIASILRRFGDRRILPFDLPAARQYARLVGRTLAAGHTLATTDAQIAAIAATHGFTVATRDTAPFVAAGVPVINPWTAP